MLNYESDFGKLKIRKTPDQRLIEAKLKLARMEMNEEKIEPEKPSAGGTQGVYPEQRFDK